ncbi:hypothetical protein AB6H10_12960 [Providencia vermicola]|uniref:hypothetical protein n=1 Tax=Providencia vermicola TaxID=333965 RepID=UPI0034DCE065
MSGIIFVDDKYATACGVKVGDDWSAATAKYGVKSKLNPENDCRFYPYFDMKLSFCLDQSNKVQIIIFESYPDKPYFSDKQTS